jgi:catechol 2,3-dioxygenase-like lactoylglutathione lyase family enzyme
MPVHGPLSHIDLSVGDPARSIPFYEAFFTALGYRRLDADLPDFEGASPTRAAWFVRYQSGAYFGIEVRPAAPESRGRAHDRYAPGLHHLAFHAESRAHVDRVHEAMKAAGATILDAPADYGGAAYSPGYYAVFVADPDGVKLEVVHEPRTNPGDTQPDRR